MISNATAFLLLSSATAATTIEAAAVVLPPVSWNHPIIAVPVGLLSVAIILIVLLNFYRPQAQTARADQIQKDAFEGLKTQIQSLTTRLQAVEADRDATKDRLLLLRQEMGEMKLTLTAEITELKQKNAAVTIQLATEREQHALSKAAATQLRSELEATRTELQLYELQSGTQAEKIEKLEKQVATLQAQNTGEKFGRRKDDKP